MNPGPLLFLATFFMHGHVVARLCAGAAIANRPAAAGGAGRTPASLIRRCGRAWRGRASRFIGPTAVSIATREQVRPAGFGSDVERGWGGRPGKVQSVDEDYLYDQPVMLGTQRVGPDLANIGKRQPDATTLLTHLYDPRLTVTNSVMPPYRFLFEKRKLKTGEKPSADALPPGKDAVPGYEILPTADGRALAAYLQSLRADGILYETPAPTNAVPKAASTNAPSATNAPAGTNAPATNSPATNAPGK